MLRPELKDVVNKTRERMEALGYRKRRIGDFTRAYTEDILGVVSLLALKKPDGLQVEPFMGVRHQPLYRLYCQFTQIDFHPYDTPLVPMRLGQNLG